MVQMTLFDLEPVDDVDFNSTPEEDVVKMIGCATGINFRYKDKLWGWVGGDRKLNFNISYSNYSFGGHERHLNCGYNYNQKGHIGGAGSPCDTVEEAIEFLKTGIERWS